MPAESFTGECSLKINLRGSSVKIKTTIGSECSSELSLSLPSKWLQPLVMRLAVLLQSAADTGWAGSSSTSGPSSPPPAFGREQDRLREQHRQRLTQRYTRA
ncbi:unnamed protein product [Pleuronectes platessa]|uniref:Uncharacterized protein n=1 Tax=Pleuronectes platessa TaxID=8262 RepID=A0A9N7YW07_PLEPL|nr:unnamed protein product [Pleuronectes platessa]